MNAIVPPALDSLSVDQLTGRLHELRREERHRLVEFLRYLGELERRRALPALGFSGAFAFCTEYLGLTKSAAFRRTTAARLLARFPIVGHYLADGRLCLTTLVELRDVLEEERLDEILARAAGRTEDQVKALVAALRPQPAPAELLRRLPNRRSVNDAESAGPAPSDNAGAASAPSNRAGASPAPSDNAGAASAPSNRAGAGPAPSDNAGAGPAPSVRASAGPAPSVRAGAGPAPSDNASAGPSARPERLLTAVAPTGLARPAPANSPARLEAIAEDRYVLRVTVDADFVAELQAVRAALSHQLPAATLGDVLRECVHVMHQRCQQRRRGAARPASAGAPSTASTRRAPVEIRAAVWARDGERCAYVAADGRRCTSTFQLELHHLVPFAVGGETSVDNLGVRCRVHNQHAADEDFGRDHMERARQLALL